MAAAPGTAQEADMSQYQPEPLEISTFEVAKRSTHS
jgi:hypothetical protein